MFGTREHGPEVAEAAQQEQIINAFAQSIERIYNRTRDYEQQGLSQSEINAKLLEERARFAEAEEALNGLEVNS